MQNWSWNVRGTLTPAAPRGPPVHPRVVVVAATLFLALLATLLVAQQPRSHLLELAHPRPFANYNHSYPLSPPRALPSAVHWRLGVVARDGQVVDGELLVPRDPGAPLSVQWAGSRGARLDRGGRAVAVAALQVFNGRLFVADGVDGVVSEAVREQRVLAPRLVLAAGAGDTSETLRVAWLAVRDRLLWAGPALHVAAGAEAYVKVASPTGQLKHVDWAPLLAQLRRHAPETADMFVRAVQWSAARNAWVVLVSDTAPGAEPARHAAWYVLDEDDARRVARLAVDAGALPVAPVAFKFVPETEDTLALVLTHAGTLELADLGDSAPYRRMAPAPITPALPAATAFEFL